MALEPVEVLEDNDGHLFVVPAYLGDKFYDLLSEAESKDDYTEFEKVFEEFATGGGLGDIQLFADLNKIK